MSPKHWLYTVPLRLRSIFHRHRIDSELDEELRYHIDMQIEENVAKGLNRDEARRSALLVLGGLDQKKEECRDARGLRWLNILLQDIRYVQRTWMHRPGFAITAIGVLSLALGASTALFSVLDRILFRSLPYPEADRIVSLGISRPPFPTEYIPERGYVESWHPVPDPFESVATIFAAGMPCDITERGPERLSCANVESSLLKVLKQPVLLGRDFNADDDQPGAALVSLITHDLWTRRFAKDPNVVRRTINLNGKSASIIGVLPPNFEMPVGKADIILPLQVASLDPKGTATRFLSGIGRLKTGAAIEQARSVARMRLEGMLQHLAPRMRQEAKIVVRPLLDRQIGDAPRMAWLLLCAVATLLLIACVSVVNLLLARIASQQREFSIRSAIGAGKVELVRLALTETLFLTIAGGTAGLLIAALLLKSFIVIAPASIPKISQASLDIRVFMIVAALTISLGVLMGFWPAVAVWRNSHLHLSRSTIAIKPRARFILVTTQIALAITMLGGSALFLRTLWKLTSIPLGFDPEKVVLFSATLNRVKYPQFDQQTLFFDNLMQRARLLPGTLSIALSDAPPPLGVSVILSSIAVDGHPFPDDATGPGIRQRIVTAHYFETFGIPMLQGHGFRPMDVQNAEPEAILSERAAKILFPGLNPIGRYVRPQSMYPWHVVVGVAQDVRNMGLADQPQPELYLARRSSDLMWVPSGLALRTTMRPQLAAALLRQLAADLDPELPVKIETLEEQTAVLSERPRFVACLLTAFAAIALLLATSGLYGVSSYLVVQRTRDFGIRIALGARPSHLLHILTREAALWVFAGMLMGMSLAWFGGKMIRSQLFEIAPMDAISWGMALLVLSVGLVVAVLRPAIHAIHINPIDALRVE